MKQAVTMATAFLLSLAVSGLAVQPSVNVTNKLTSMPLTFTENQGQWDAQVLFRADAGGATMWFTGEGAHYQFIRRIDEAQNDIAESHRRMGGPGGDEHISGLGRDKVETMLNNHHKLRYI